MSSQLRLQSRILETRQLLADGREKLRQQHAAGSPGIQLGTYLTDLLDTAVLSVHESAIRAEDAVELASERIALVAHGGYGRRDAAPFSDVDLMLLHHPSAISAIPAIARRLVQDLSDVGLDLGFSVRTTREAYQMAKKDPVIFTSLVESRFLTGSEPLFSKYFDRFRRWSARSAKSLIKTIENSRLAERRRYGETVYLLEPNVKRSRGGLRDIHLLRWIGFAKYGAADPESLRRMGLLSPQDHGKLRAALNFLLRLRNDLHFHASTSQDVLTRPEQLRLAELYEYSGDEGVLPVERFMQDYFRHTSEVRNIVSHFLAAAKWDSPLRMTLHNLFGKTFDQDYLVGPTYVSAKQAGQERVKGDLVEVLRLMDLSNRHNKRIDHHLWQVIRESMSHTELETISPQAAQQFMTLMSEPARLGKLLRRLHELRVLEKLLPGFAHARCLLQFNEYHKYTVDEHSFRAVERATELMHDDGILGRVYRKIKQKSTLHLALLIHDIGKGYPEDHSEVGKRHAQKIAQHLQMPAEEADRLEFLVHRHLMLNHLAFRRDNSDESILLEAASQIGSPANLRMLFVLSCADLAAVGPGVLNQWKLEVLSDLYRRIMDTLSGETATGDFDQRLAPQTARLLDEAQELEDGEWLSRQINSLPPAYLRTVSTATILDDLQRLRSLPAQNALAWGRYLPNQEIAEYWVGAEENIADGIFHRLAGAITSQGLRILSAEIHSLADSLFLDKFCVHDPDYNGEPPPIRFEQVSRKLVESLHGDLHEPPTFRQVWQGQRDSNSTLTALPTRIRIDNSTSDRFTILDVFAHDRPGLLYAIAKTLHEGRVSVRIAKIGTYLDQVVDVFYVTDGAGQKIESELQLDEIRSRLYHAIESWEE